MSTPPYLNVANMNLNVFQINSQKHRALRIIADPDKAIFDDTTLQDLKSAEADDTGIVAQSSLTFGADIAQVFGSDARYEFVEPTGKGVELSNVEVAQIEKNIDGKGAELVERSNVSATEAEISNTTATAADVHFSNNLEDALNKAYTITQQVDSSLQDARITLNRDFARQTLSDSTITALNTATLSGNLSKESFLTSVSTGRTPTFADEAELNDELNRIEDEGMGLENDRV